LTCVFNRVVYSFAILLLNTGIANTMDLPEKLLPRISSRMGIQRLCFGPYNYRQLLEIITSRLKGINAFEEQAIEFASRKVWLLFIIYHVYLSLLLLTIPPVLRYASSLNIRYGSQYLWLWQRDRPGVCCCGR
jgi:hypothetical protein